MMSGGTEHDPLVVVLRCQSCGADFPFAPQTFSVLGLRELPKRCPRCCDERQRRPLETTAISRRCLAEFRRVALYLPDDIPFRAFTASKGDRPCLRAVVKGSSLPGWGGASWSGRLDIYCPAETVPSIARVRVMEVLHAAGHRRVEKHGAPMGPKTEVEVEYPSTYTYLALEPDESEPLAALVAPWVDYKTTLKGFGRQWHATLDASRALWACRLSRQARSSRFGTLGAIAVVDDDHPVVTRQTGDVKSLAIFNLSSPQGA